MFLLIYSVITSLDLLWSRVWLHLLASKLFFTTGEDEVHQEEVLTMISDDEEELNFLTGGNIDTSSSEGEEEENLAHLMVSQELRPGFLDSASSEQLEDDLSRLNLQVGDKWQQVLVITKQVSDLILNYNSMVYISHL